MRKHYKHRKKYRRNNIDITQECLYKKPAKEEIEIKPAPAQSEQKIGFWKAVWLIIRNKEPQDGNKTATLLAEVMAVMFNAIAIIGVGLFVLIICVSIFALNWEGEVPNCILQGAFVGILLVTSLAISLIFRGIANEIKAEKGRNYITSLFFGLISIASLIVTLITFFKGVG